ncbi:hypothetical protein IL38_23940 [Actinopolyspora erythraea]|uniref:Uncharacterized protein n=1 Tax=Actinopolyspora erythraea TaxID=414996 RepID=A0ABR4WY95_9ACTN|nr:hypothetical protein [Actinopolyspora erythraea]KGI79356.1 hypothetical protein IL38_23940 [Actinopolyspora erythraea]
MTDPSSPEPGPPTFLVITPHGELLPYTEQQEREVEELVGGHYGPTALDRAWIEEPLRMMVSDLGLLAPEHFAPNPTATAVLTALAGRQAQQLNGHVALFEMEQDSGPGSIGEWLWPTPMSAEWRRKVETAHQEVTQR